MEKFGRWTGMIREFVVDTPVESYSCAWRERDREGFLTYEAIYMTRELQLVRDDV
jgi:hypothetical protein